MANAIYPKYKQSLLNGDSNTALTGSGATGLYVALVTSSYTYNSAHQFYSDITGVVGTDQEIGTVTLTNGLIDGDNLTYTAVAGGSTVAAMVFYRKNAGANTTWRLVAYEDTGVTGLPLATNGGDITVTWDASGIIQL